MKLSLTLVFKILLGTVLLFGSLGFIEAQTAVAPEIGDGTEDNPYQIATLENLYWITASDDVVPEPDQAARWSSHYMQTANINASSTRNWFNGQGWQPIGTERNRFSGHYDGGNYTITDIRIVGFMDLGLFGYIDQATIINVGVINGYSAGSGGSYCNPNRFAGLVIGRSVNSKIFNCYSTGNVSASCCAGGLVAISNHSVISNCFSKAEVRSRVSGGLVARTRHSTIENSYTIGNIHSEVTQYDIIGGLIGGIDHSIIKRCFSGSTVSGLGQHGGLISSYDDPSGRVTSAVRNSFWGVDISGQEQSCGGKGISTEEMKTMEAYLNENWDFDDTWIIDGATNNGYPYLRWQKTNIQYPPPANLTLTRENDNVNLHWHAPQNYSPDLVLRGYNIYRNNSLIYSATADITQYMDNVVDDNHNYFVTAVYEEEESPPSNTAAIIPCITPPIASQPAFGDGSRDRPYQVENLENLYWIAVDTERWDKHYIQKQNIDASNTVSWFEGLGWEPIGYYHSQDIFNPFTGTYDGQNYYINNLNIDREVLGYRVMRNTLGTGLFGVTENSTIKNTHLRDVDIRGNMRAGGLLGWSRLTNIFNCSVTGSIEGHSDVGGLIGTVTESIVNRCTASVTIRGIHDRNYTNVGGLVGRCLASIIENSSSSGKVTGYGVIGGLVGSNESETLINKCFSNSEVKGDGRVGGLVGANRANIRNSYSSGPISGSFIVGGLVGFNHSANIYDCFSTSLVKGETDIGGLGGLVGYHQGGRIWNSYWDIEKSGQDESAGGRGRTTVEMTYPHCEQTYLFWDFNEWSRVWRKDENFVVNDGYPYLYWQKPIKSETAYNPFPKHESINVPVDLDSLSWSWELSYDYPNQKPAGFKVYFDETSDFTDDYIWVPYIEGQTDYHCADILPKQLDYETMYYWKVLPAKENPNRSVTVDTNHYSFDENTKEMTSSINEPYFSDQQEIKRIRNKKVKNIQLDNNATCWDDIDFPIWSFTTKGKETSAEDNTLALVTRLGDNFPNPFNPDTVISFTVSQDTDVHLAVYNIRGQIVSTLHKGFIKTGEHRVIWNGKDDNGRDVSTGVYFYRLKADHYDQVNKMLLVK